MDNAIRLKLIEALEGPYKDRHGRNRLASPNEKRCCLGVLCEIQGGVFANDERGHLLLDGKHPVVASTIPEKYAAGLSLSTMQYLATLNDSSHDFGRVVYRLKEMGEPTE